MPKLWQIEQNVVLGYSWVVFRLANSRPANSDLKLVWRIGSLCPTICLTFLSSDLVSVTDFCQESETSVRHRQRLAADGAEHRGFNLTADSKFYSLLMEDIEHLGWNR